MLVTRVDMTTRTRTTKTDEDSDHGKHLISRQYGPRWAYRSQEDNFSHIKQRTIKASIVLQSLIYFNSLFSLVFFLVQLVLSMYKSITFQRYKDNSAQYLDLGFFLLWAIVEPIRIYNGYFGNLNEKVSMISTFLLLTCMPQIIILIYLSVDLMAMPFSIVSSIILVVFGAMEIGFGYFTLRKLFVHNRAGFAFSVSSVKAGGYGK